MHLRLSWIILVHNRSLKVDSDQSWACLVHSELYVRRIYKWDGIGMVIIGQRSSKSTFGADNGDVGG